MKYKGFEIIYDPDKEKLSRNQMEVGHNDAAIMDSVSRWAEQSKEKKPNRRVAALFVRDGRPFSEGYNGTASGTNNEMRDEEGLTKPHVIHAEMNALAFAAKHGYRTDDCAVYCTYSPCWNCASTLMEAGISAFYFQRYYAKTRDSVIMLLEKNIQVFQIMPDKGP